MHNRNHYRLYVLALLWAAALLRFVDMQILAVLLQSIKAEFHLSDTGLALLGGLAFALFYGVLGIPVAWLAERYCRRTIIAIAVTLWSLMTVLCGQAGSFTMLFLARVGVGIGEAGAYPPTTSLLADYFPPALRGRACAVIASAIPIGVLVGFLAGTFLNVHLGWRLTLQLLGVPGVLLGVLLLLTLQEPPRGSADHKAVIVESGNFRQSSVSLWQRRGYATLVAATCLFTMGASGSGLFSCVTTGWAALKPASGWQLFMVAVDLLVLLPVDGWHNTATKTVVDAPLPGFASGRCALPCPCCRWFY